MSSVRLDRWSAAAAGLVVAQLLVPSLVASLSVRTVRVDGHPIRVATSGLDGRAPGEPVVVFEAGAGSSMRAWGPLLSAVASFSPYMAYDRSGIGASPWDSLPPTPERVTARVRALLAELDIRPPYLLVGHSWGGPLVRHFAGTHPDEVVGLMYIDPTDFSSDPAEEHALLESLAPGGVGVAFMDEARRAAQSGLLAARPSRGAEHAVIRTFLSQEPGRRGLPPAPAVPTSVVVAGRGPAPLMPGAPFDTDAYWAATRATRVENLKRWVVEPGEYIESSSADHFVHHDDLQTVATMIRELIVSVSR